MHLSIIEYCSKKKKKSIVPSESENIGPSAPVPDNLTFKLNHNMSVVQLERKWTLKYKTFYE